MAEEEEEEELQVFGFWASPFSRRVELALKLKGLDYQYFEEDLRSNKSDLLLKYNPIYKKVPVLVHRGQPISESLVILEYIEENWRHNPLFPEDPYERALARFWAKYIDDEVVSSGVVKAARSRGEGREKGVEEAGEALEALEKVLQNKLFFGGDRIGFVDIVGLFVAYWVPAIEQGFGFELVTTNNFPNLSRWSRQLLHHSVVKEVLPPKDKLVTHIKAVL